MKSETNHENQVSEVINDILHNGDSVFQKDCRDSYVFMHIVAKEDKKKGCPYYSIDYFDKKDGAYYQGFGSYNYKIVLAYKQAYFSDCNENYALDRLEELNEKHWSECQMIANYDNELGQAVKILEKLPKLHRAILLEAPAAAATMGSVLLESSRLLDQIKRTTYHEEEQETMTEADVIRNMTDDELAKFLNGVERQGYETRGHEGAEFKGYGNANIAWWKGFLMNPAGEDY